MHEGKGVFMAFTARRAKALSEHVSSESLQHSITGYGETPVPILLHESSRRLQVTLRAIQSLVYLLL
jgi:hypothetical protein